MSKLRKWLDAHYDKRASILFGPVFTVLMFNLVLTIVRQPSAYWVDFSKVNEENIVGRWLLEIDPLAFIYAFLIYVVAIYVLLLYSGLAVRLFVFFISSLYHANAVTFYFFDDIIKLATKSLPKSNVSENDIVLSFQLVLLVLFFIYVLITLSKYLNQTTAKK